MVILCLKFQRAMPLPHKILSYIYINHFLQNWIFHFREILFWWEEKLLLNIFSNVFTKFWRSKCPRVLHWNWINEQEIRCHPLRQAPSWTTYVSSQGSSHCILHLFVFRCLSDPMLSIAERKAEINVTREYAYSIKKKATTPGIRDMKVTVISSTKCWVC